MATPQQLQELVAAVQNLNLEVQALKTANTALQQRVTAREQQATDLPPLPLVSGKFDGSEKRVKEFLEACNIHFAFRQNAFSTDHAKVGFMITQMTGNALAWATPLVSQSDPVLQNFVAFKDLLKQTFLRTESAHLASEDLLDVRQGSSDLLSYISSFKRLAAETGGVCVKS
ncbi:protein LDOC1-like [Ambystoma mexicanum]|uniref:protein LDOC1-like n=1 Tax=Ambystoma mexicanum TaxID=8296 RepID=UPI0037E8A13E